MRRSPLRKRVFWSINFLLVICTPKFCVADDDEGRARFYLYFQSTVSEHTIETTPTGKPFEVTLSKEEVTDLVARLKAFLKTHEEGMNVVFGFDSYYIQVYASTKDELAFFATHQSESHRVNLRKQIADVFGGGQKYWQVYFDMEKRTFKKVSINGDF